MPIARFQLPDGRIARFEVPDGTTPEQAQAMMEAHFAAPQGNVDREPPVDPTGSFGENLAAGAGKAVVDTGERLSQLGWKGINAVTGNSVPLFTDAENALQQRIDEEGRLSDPLMRTGGGVTGDIAGQVAETAIPMAKAADAMKGANLLTRVALPGVAQNELTQPTGEGPGRLSELTNPAVGAAGGVAGGAVGGGLKIAARGMSDVIDPYVAQGVRYLNAKGVPTSLDQLTQSEGLQFLRSLVKSVPGSGGKAFDNEQRSASTEAVAKLFGENADSLTDDVLDRAQTRIGNTIKSVVPPTHQIPLDQQFYTDIRNMIAREEQSTAPNNALVTMGKRILGESQSNPQYQQVLKQTQGWSPQAQAQALQGIPQQIVVRPPLFQGDVMSGAQYATERTDLGRKAFAAYKAGDHETGRALEAIQSAFDDAANQTLTGAEQQTLNAARSQYRNLMTVVPAIKPGLKGELDIDALNQSVAKRDPEAYNFGRGPNAEVAFMAKALKEIADQPASSPLWKKIAVLGPLSSLIGATYATGGPIGAGSTVFLGSRGVNSALTSPALQRYMMQGAGPRTRNILELLATGSPPAAVAASDRIAEQQ